MLQAILLLSFTLGARSSISTSEFSLKDIVIPGTHDSGTYYLTGDMFPDFKGRFVGFLRTFSQMLGRNITNSVKRWAQTQSLDLYTQFKMGIRYADIRAGWDPVLRRWRVHHMVYGHDIRTLLNDTKTFLNEEPDAVLILEFSKLWGGAKEQEKIILADMIYNYLGPFLCNRTDTNCGLDVPLKEMYGKSRVFAVFNEKGSSGANVQGKKDFLWPAATLLNSYANSDDPQKMFDFNVEKVREFNQNRPENALQKISWALTVKLTSFSKFKTTHDMAKSAKKKLEEFDAITQTEKLQVGNIFMVDFFDHIDAVGFVSRNNAIEKQSSKSGG